MIYLSGKVLHVLDGQLVLRIPSGMGYLLHVNPSSKHNINDNIDFYIIYDPAVMGPNHKIYALDTFDEWLLMRQMVAQGMPIEIATNIIYEMGLGPLQKSITTKDDSLLKRIPGITTRQIKQIMDIGDDCMALGKSSFAITSTDENGDETKTYTYTAAEFTEKMSQLGYTRSKVVEVIGMIKGEGLWGNLSLVDLVKKAISLIEEGYL